MQHAWAALAVAADDGYNKILLWRSPLRCAVQPIARDCCYIEERVSGVGGGVVPV